MDKWKYSYSFLSGILFLFSFVFKEMVINSPNQLSSIVFVIPYILMMLYSVGLFLGYIKYAKLNERHALFFSSCCLSLAYLIMVIIELLDRFMPLAEISLNLILIPNLFLSSSLLYFSVILFIQKRIYGKRTILQGFNCFVLGLSFMIPYLYILKLPMFILMFISLTYLIRKNENKLIKKKSEPRMLKGGRF